MILVLFDDNCQIKFEIEKDLLEQSTYFNALFSNKFSEKIVDNKFKLKVDNAPALYTYLNLLKGCDENKECDESKENKENLLDSKETTKDLLSLKNKEKIEKIEEINEMCEYYDLNNIITDKLKLSCLINLYEKGCKSNKILQEINVLSKHINIPILQKQILQNIKITPKILCNSLANYRFCIIKEIDNFNYIGISLGSKTDYSFYCSLYYFKDKIVYEDVETSYEYYFNTSKTLRYFGKYSPVKNDRVSWNTKNKKIVFSEKPLSLKYSDNNKLKIFEKNHSDEFEDEYTEECSSCEEDDENDEDDEDDEDDNFDIDVVVRSYSGNYSIIDDEQYKIVDVYTNKIIKTYSFKNELLVSQNQTYYKSCKSEDNVIIGFSKDDSILYEVFRQNTVTINYLNTNEKILFEKNFFNEKKIYGMNISNCNNYLIFIFEDFFHIYKISTKEKILEREFVKEQNTNYYYTEFSKDNKTILINSVDDNYYLYVYDLDNDVSDKYKKCAYGTFI